MQRSGFGTLVSLAHGLSSRLLSETSSRDLPLNNELDPGSASGELVEYIREKGNERSEEEDEDVERERSSQLGLRSIRM